MERRVGFLGLGKLGLPCAAALSAETGREVNGFDINPEVAQYIRDCKVPYQEWRIEEYLQKAKIRFFEDFDTFLASTDIVFIAVQTPHEPEFEGNVPVPGSTRDFDYSYLGSAIDKICNHMSGDQTKSLTVVVISTVLPGTMKTVVLQKLAGFGARIKFCYNPFFIAMGTTIKDYLQPEFVLVGEYAEGDSNELVQLYSEVHDAEVIKMQIESAELTKVAYNTFIGFKIVFSNTISEIVQARGGNSDEVTNALAKATQRLISGKYLSAGMADGGGCHPRDQIAMSWLAQDVDLSSNIFDFLARARDSQTQRQAEMILEMSKKHNLPVWLLGYAYKADVNLTVGSPAALLSHFLRSLDVNHRIYDPFCFPDVKMPDSAAVFFVATNHSQFKDLTFPEGSYVIDPWGNAITAREGSTFHFPGREATR